MSNAVRSDIVGPRIQTIKSKIVVKTISSNNVVTLDENINSFLASLHTELTFVDIKFTATEGSYRFSAMIIMQENYYD